MDYYIEMINITKKFPGIIANDNVTFRVKKGEIHALLGENGAGKSTLMSILFGLYQPDSGTIKINGRTVRITDPNVANGLGIGMVHQHFKLVHNFTVTENIVLGLEPKKTFGKIDIELARDRVQKISDKYGLKVNPDALIEDISVGMQQRVEILKMLYRNADIMIFDEPTAVLTPQEIDELMNIMRQFANEGKAIIIITHKLKEIKKVADSCTVLRKGKLVSSVIVSTTSEKELARLMVGRDVNFVTPKGEFKPGETILQITDLRYTNEHKKLNIENLVVREGEILGIAGIEGNGQTEFVEVLTGLKEFQDGVVLFLGKDINGLTIREKSLHGIAHIPEDRHKHGLVLEYSLENNIILQDYFRYPFSHMGFLNYRSIRRYTIELIERFDIRSGKGPETLTRSMSGGNQQKAIVGRELARNPRLLIAVQPTRGLDVGAIEFIHKELVKARDDGRAVLLVSLELDEILNLSDNIAVMYEGKIVGKLSQKEANENNIGLLMSGGGKSE